MKRSPHSLSALALALTLTACASARTEAPPPVDLGEFPAAAYERIPLATVRGTSAVNGRASATRPGGKPRAASEAALVPVAPYASAWVEALVAGRPVPTVDPRLDAYVRRATPDAEGRFELRDVPPGAYHVVATITWEVPRCFTSAGGSVKCLPPKVLRKVLSRTVTLRDGATARVSMED